MSSTMADVLDERGYDVVLADVWSNEVEIDDREFHSQVIMGAACDGSIIVLHAPDRESRNQTLGIIADTVPILRNRGLRLVRLSDMVAEEPSRMPPCGSCTLCSLSAVITVFTLPPLLVCCMLRCLSLLWRHSRAPCCSRHRPAAKYASTIAVSIRPAGEQPSAAVLGARQRLH